MERFGSRSLQTYSLQRKINIQPVQNSKMKYKKGFYENFSKEELILRDHLAIDRTTLSNESTFLAYIRTSLALMAGGGTLFHFFAEIYIQILGISLVILGISVLILGYRRFRKMDKEIKKIKRV